MGSINKYSATGIVLIIIILMAGCSQPRKHVREVNLFTANWQFHLGDAEDGQNPEFDDLSWRTLDLPHDWSIEGEFSEDHPAGVSGGALPGGIGWYRKSFTIPESDSGKIYFIEFDGIYRKSEVWLNGEYLGNRPNGYISFRYELTPHLNIGGKNVLAVRVDNSQQPNSRWYSGSGIYRNVRLVKTHPLHIDQWGTYITTPEINDNSATVLVKTQLVNKLPNDQNFALSTTVYNEQGIKIAALISDEQTIRDSLEIIQEVEISNPLLWSVETPTLYTTVSQVSIGDDVIDDYETRFGIRDFHFDLNEGFFLNGEHVKILGVCEHHDLGALGAAVNKSAIERRLNILKEMGVNAIRTAHNPPSKELLELTDEMGFIVMDEIFDSWKRNKTEFGYYQDWDEWYKKDLQDFIRRDRNHPSVIMWSIGNEIIEQWHPEGTPMAKELAGIVRELDDTRPITSGMNDPAPHNSLIKSGELDLVGFNYHHQWFEDFQENFPGQKMIGAETTSALATRGEYHMPSDSIMRWPEAWDKPFEDGNDEHTVSSYDNVSAPWGSTHEETWREVKGRDFVSGMFIWTGFDYLGEPTPYGWPSRSSYFGIIDLAGFPKDVYYMYQSEWTDTDVLHLFPHWNWEEGDMVDVWAYSSTEEVELFLNGESLGRKAKNDSSFHTFWRVPFQPGTIRAVAYKEDGSTLEKEVNTAGSPASLRLVPDRTQLKADGLDLSFIRVEVLDDEGNIVPNASNKITFEIEGAGSIAGVDNGDPTSLESFKANFRKAFNGLALVMVQAEKEPGRITLKAISDGLEGDKIVISSTNI
ncbi:MAG: beta-galactosidase GalB [Balneolaceae bacterium]